MGDIATIVTLLKAGQNASPTGGSTGAASTVLKGQLVTAEGVVIEVDIEGSGALVGVMGLPSDHPSGMEEDIHNLWESISGTRVIQRREGTRSGESLGQHQESKEEEGENAPGYKCAWDKSINPTQEPIEGTNIPRSFTIKGMEVNGNEVWVHGNATKHMGEYVNAANGSVIVENELMISFQNALSEILPQVQPGRNFFYVNGWEIGINGDNGVVYHALYK